MDLIQELSKKIQSPSTRLVFPEGEEINIIKAARLIKDNGIASPILLGDAQAIREIASSNQIGLEDISLINPADSPRLEDYANIYSRERNFSPKAALKIVQPVLGFGAMMVKTGDADAMVAGIAHPTATVIMVSELTIGMQPGISTTSSFMVLDVPGFQGSEGSQLVIADPAINPDPTSEQLADIAICTAESVQKIFGWEPRVAMLSFSTHGSATHPKVDKVRKAVELVNERKPDLLVDGDLQLDAAIVPDVAQRKVKVDSRVAGKANVLIFPELNSGNIGVKLVQRLANAKAYGAVLQGFALPVSDLSRGATVEDIVGVTTLLLLRGKVE